MGLGFGSGDPFWGSILVPVVRFGASVWCRWSVFGARFWFRWFVLGFRFGAGGPFLGLGFGSGGPFWGFILVPVVRFGASVRRLGVLVPVIRFGARFWFWWSVLGLHFCVGGPF